MTTRVAIASVSLVLVATTLARAQDLAPPTTSPESTAEPAPAPEAAPAPEPTPTPTPPPAPAIAPVPAVSPEPSSHPVGVPDADEEPETARRRWYGWQTLIADGSVLALLTAAAFSGEISFVYVALGGYVLGTPIVHATHGNPGRSFASVSLRVVAPIVVGAAANAASDCVDDEFCAVSIGGYGFLGALGVMALDAAVFAYDDADVSAPRVVPVVALNPGMTYVGARGAF